MCANPGGDAGMLEAGFITDETTGARYGYVTGFTQPGEEVRAAFSDGRPVTVPSTDEGAYFVAVTPADIEGGVLPGASPTRVERPSSHRFHVRSSKREGRRRMIGARVLAWIVLRDSLMLTAGELGDAAVPCGLGVSHGMLLADVDAQPRVQGRLVQLDDPGHPASALPPGLERIGRPDLQLVHIGHRGLVARWLCVLPRGRHQARRRNVGHRSRLPGLAALPQTPTEARQAATPLGRMSTSTRTVSCSCAHGATPRRSASSSRGTRARSSGSSSRRHGTLSVAAELTAETFAVVLRSARRFRGNHRRGGRAASSTASRATSPAAGAAGDASTTPRARACTCPCAIPPTS